VSALTNLSINNAENTLVRIQAYVVKSIADENGSEVDWMIDLTHRMSG
jgi:hypothetical protein